MNAEIFFRMEACQRISAGKLKHGNGVALAHGLGINPTEGCHA